MTVIKQAAEQGFYIATQYSGTANATEWRIWGWAIVPPLVLLGVGVLASFVRFGGYVVTLAAVVVTVGVTHRLDTWVRHHSERYPFGYDNVPDNTNKPGLQSTFDTGQWERSARSTVISIRQWLIVGALAALLLMVLAELRRRRGRQWEDRAAAVRADRRDRACRRRPAALVASSLTREPVASVVRDLRAYAAVEDRLARERIRAREAEVGSRISNAERYELYGAAPPLAISSATADLLYALARARRPLTAVEFGASHGVSTIALACALRDAGAGTLVSTELIPEKAAAARANLAAAGLDDLVELRTGDALETLRDVHGPVDLVFLDGRNDLYLDVLRLLEPVLAPGALVLADLSDDRDLAPYLAHVRAAYSSLNLLGPPGLEVTIHA